MLLVFVELEQRTPKALHIFRPACFPSQPSFLALAINNHARTHMQKKWLPFQNPHFLTETMVQYFLQYLVQGVVQKCVVAS